MSRSLGIDPRSTAAEHVDCEEAADELGIAPNALAHWSRELGFPRDVGAPDAPRFARREVEALARALPTAHSVPGAIRAARERVAG